MAKIVKKNLNKKDNSIDRYLKLGRSFYNKKQVLYKGDDSLWFAIYIWNKCLCDDFYEYMDQCMDYDKLNNNYKRTREWKELLSKNMSIEQMKYWAEQEYKKEWSKLMNSIQEEIKREKFNRRKGVYTYG